MKNYIKKKKSEERNYTLSGIEILVRDPVSDDVNIKNVIEKAITLVPRNLFKFIKKINIGQFEILNNRELDALYKDNTIYLTNLQKSEFDMLDDIVHEVAHSLEEVYSDLIYSDGKIKEEFIIKRRIMQKHLKQAGHHISPEKYSIVSYDEEFDIFLYQDVGYKALSSLTSSLFLSPYAATSLREYFANGFENILLSQESYQILRKLSPRLFEKLIELISLEEEK